MVEGAPEAPPPVRVGEREKAKRGECPACGSGRYHHTHRTNLERLLRRPPMVRCENCGLRFRHSGHGKRKSEPRGAAPTEARSTEEVKAPKMANQNTQAPTPAVPAEPSNGNLPHCPACGSTKHHRTERKTLERMLRRPPMARCEKCGKRFPYGSVQAESPGWNESGQSPTSRDRAREEQGSPGTIEGSYQAAVGSLVSTVDTDEDFGHCPFCGSKTYRRSRRTSWERLLFRPRMARCSHCRKRFPFPSR